VSFPLVIQAVASGTTETGGHVRSNPLQFTLSMVHLCGNGRVETALGEECDPNAPNTCGIGPCQSGSCKSNDRVPCATDADCGGSCMAQGDPMECTCVY
jgi:hypothetical protein